MVNWSVACFQVRGGIFQPLPILRTVTLCTFVAASSVGKCPQFDDLLKQQLEAVDGISRVDYLADLGRVSKEWNRLLPLTPPHGDNVREFLTPRARRNASAFAAR